MAAEPLAARNLARYGLRRGAYDGSNRRRFVLYEDGENNGESVTWTREYDTKGERDAAALARLEAIKAEPGRGTKT